MRQRGSVCRVKRTVPASSRMEFTMPSKDLRLVSHVLYIREHFMGKKLT